MQLDSDWKPAPFASPRQNEEPSERTSVAGTVLLGVAVLVAMGVALVVIARSILSFSFDESTLFTLAACVAFPVAIAKIVLPSQSTKSSSVGQLAGAVSIGIGGMLVLVAVAMFLLVMVGFLG